MVEYSKTARATTKSSSLRTTIPTGIAKHFNLKVSQDMSWEIKAGRSGEFYIVVKPIKAGRRNAKK